MKFWKRVDNIKNTTEYSYYQGYACPSVVMIRSTDKKLEVITVQMRKEQKKHTTAGNKNLPLVEIVVGGNCKMIASIDREMQTIFEENNEKSRHNNSLDDGEESEIAVG